MLVAHANLLIWEGQKGQPKYVLFSKQKHSGENVILWNALVCDIRSEFRGRLVPKNFHLPFKYIYEVLNVIK